MNILCWNLHGFKTLDGRREIAPYRQAILDISPDIVMLQEFETRFEKGFRGDAELDDLSAGYFPYTAYAPTHRDQLGGWYGNVILSRYPLYDETWHDLSYESREPRLCQEVKVDIEGPDLRLFNLHFGLNRRERASQAKKLADLIYNYPPYDRFLVAGDMNDWQFTSPVRRALRKGLKEAPTKASFPTAFPILRLDKAWCRPDHLIKSHEILKGQPWRVLSDHYPILIELDLSS